MLFTTSSIREQSSPACSLRLSPSEAFAVVALRGGGSSAIIISAGATFIACEALQRVAGDLRRGDPLKTPGVDFERPTVLCCSAHAACTSSVR